MRVRLALLWLLCGWIPVAPAQSLLLGAPAPAFQAITLSGQHEDSHDWRGRYVLLAFVASWCPPCRHELPVLARFAAAHRQHFKLMVVALDEADELGDLRAMIEGLHLDPALAQATQAQGYGRIWRLPVSFVIDPQGRLVYNGWNDEHPAWTAERLASYFKPWLAGQSAASPEKSVAASPH